MSALLASDASGSEFEFAIDVKVNGREIPREAIYKEMQYHPADTPRDAIYAAARALVFGELLRERAIALELCDADIETASEAFDQALEQLLQQEVPVAEPAEAECRAYFEQHREKFRSEPLAEVRHILLAAEPNDADALAKANVSALELLKQIQDAGDPLLAFAELAKSVSGCSSNASGGSLGQIGRGDTVGPFQQAVFAQGSGLVPQPVETEYGVHLIYVEHSEPGQPLEFDYVSDRIADYLQERQRRQLTDAYLQELVKNAEISGLDL